MVTGSPMVKGGSTRPRRKTVAGRLLVSFVAVMLAFAITLGYGIVTQRRTARDSELLRTGYVPLLLSLGAALENQNLVSAQLNHITEAKNPSDARRWIETARRVRPSMFAGVRAAADSGVAPSADPDARKLASQVMAETLEIERFLDGDREQLTRLFDALATDRTGAEQYRAVLLSHETEGARRLRDLKARVEREMDRLIADARDRERLGIGSLIALTLLTMAVGIGMTLHARRVLRPLAAVTARANAVARGDMTPREVVAAPDEIGELAATFEGMVAAISKANRDRLQHERLAVVGRMAAHVTHEIRNPLSSIGLNLELLEEEMTAPETNTEARQLVQAIKREVDHLSALSEEYLSLARPLKPRFEAEKLGDIVSDMVTFVAPELDRAGVALELQIAEVPDVLADETQVRQALTNLIRNGREAMPKGGTMRIAVERSGERVRLVVEDSGQGIPDEIRQNIFDPFFTTKNRGTGLGLAVTRQIVEAHHGSIACEPAAPQGTRFVIELPTASLEAASP
ncbi:MAG: HAMP domain-containing histidine kinase [Deltaproteobacteria bacterium]|nr:HAMP domain-containing histidine kinase [Deltaproteobacteria bacterium]